jgi:transposase
LKARLAQNSSNSSRPPSSNPPGAVSPRTREPTGRKRGGQPGHKKHERRLLPPDRLDAVHVLKPPACRRCGDALLGHDAAPHRHQVIDIPRLVARGVEYQLHALRCPRCQITTQATLPEGVPSTVVGPRLQAMAAVCTGAYRMSKRMVEEMLSDFLDADISLGLVCNLEQRTSEAVAPAVAEALAAVQAAPVKHADETSWREARQKAWLWVAATSMVAVFMIRRSRAASVAHELLGQVFYGVLNSDRWSAYNWIRVDRRQICWAHLKRHWTAFEDHGPEARRIGKALQRATGALFDHWYRARDGTLRWSSFREYARPLQREIVGLLRQGQVCPSKKVAGMCREILALEDALWLFVRRPDVDPTNNAAERAIRHAVIWRKSSLGTDSESGSRFVERMLTVVQTLRIQRRNILDYVTAACEAAIRGHAPPSLLPLTSGNQAFAA